MIKQFGLALKSSDSSKDLWLCRTRLYTHPLDNTFIHTVHMCMTNTVEIIYSDVLKKYGEHYTYTCTTICN